jgi:hypothetical protein
MKYKNFVSREEKHESSNLERKATCKRHQTPGIITLEAEYIVLKVDRDDYLNEDTTGQSCLSGGLTDVGTNAWRLGLMGP